MNVSQLARRAGTTADTVRHYTELGLLRPARNPANGYREYGKNDLSRLNFSLQARSLGFTLQDISALIAESDAGHSPCQHTRSLIEQRLVEVGGPACDPCAGAEHRDAGGPGCGRRRRPFWQAAKSQRWPAHRRASQTRLLLLLLL